MPFVILGVSLSYSDILFVRILYTRSRLGEERIFTLHEGHLPSQSRFISPFQRRGSPTHIVWVDGSGI